MLKNYGDALKRIWENVMTSLSFPLVFIIDESLVFDENIVTNSLCDYFSTVGKKLANNIPPSKKSLHSYLPPINNSTLFLTPTNESEILKLIKTLKQKNSSGHDGISNVLLKKIGPEIALPLCIIFNKSLEEGIVPSQCKVSEVHPLYKAKCKQSLTNYRTVSLLPVISKILEKIVYARLYKFLVQHGILYVSQYGFRHNYSTVNAISEFVGKIVKGFEKNEFTLGVFLDLSKAFDTISHTILLKKLERYGIRGHALDWFKNYLDNRKQYVKLGNNCSELHNVSVGVPQGSVLGPLLFLVYVNDLSSHLENTVEPRL